MWLGASGLVCVTWMGTLSGWGGSFSATGCVHRMRAVVWDGHHGWMRRGGGSVWASRLSGWEGGELVRGWRLSVVARGRATLDCTR